MDRHSIALRAATPTFEEGLAFARYFDEAAEGFMRLVFGRRFEYIVATAFAQPDHDFSYAVEAWMLRFEGVNAVEHGHVKMDVASSGQSRTSG